MPVQIGAKPDSGFDDPLGMLHDCHRRIERFLAILCDVAERAHGRSLTGEEAAAIRARMRSLAPAGTLEPLEQLEDDHREADRLHNDVERLYSNWLSAGALNPAQEQALLEKTRRLRALYGLHIQAEETTVFPRAARLLDRDALAAIGSEFRARRASGS
jgi:hypothetical protein